MTTADREKGSGPAQLALALLADGTGDGALALSLHQRFRAAVVQRLPHGRLDDHRRLRARLRPRGAAMSRPAPGLGRPAAAAAGGSEMTPLMRPGPFFRTIAVRSLAPPAGRSKPDCAGAGKGRPSGRLRGF
jgi:hypothetical protein